MINKPRFCTSNNQLLFLFLMLVSSVSLFAMEEKPSDVPDHFLGASREEMDQVFEDAPQLAKQIVSHLKNPDYLKNISFRYAVLVGESGVGKSVLARAIAYKAEWQCVAYTPNDFMGKGRHETARVFIDCLNKEVEEGVKKVIIIDGLNQLLENYKDEQRDMGFPSSLFCKFLDDQDCNKNFFLIGTLIRADRLLPQVKSRILGRYIKIDLPQDAQARKRIFINKLLSQNLSLDADAQNYLDENSAKLEGSTGRDLGKYASIIKMHVADENNTGITLVTRKDLEQAVDKIKMIRSRLKYGENQETNEERQERHHKENLRLKDEIFVLQQLNKLALYCLINKDLPTKDEFIKNYLSFFSPEQMQIYKEIQKKIAEQSTEKDQRKDDENETETI